MNSCRTRYCPEVMFVGNFTETGLLFTVKNFSFGALVYKCRATEGNK